MSAEMLNLIKDIGVSTIVVGIALTIFWKGFQETYPTLKRIEGSLREERDMSTRLEDMNTLYSSSIIEITEVITSFKHSNEMLIKSLNHINETLIDVRKDVREDRKTHYDLMRVQEEILKSSYVTLELVKSMYQSTHDRDSLDIELTKANLVTKNTMEDRIGDWRKDKDE